MMKRPIPSSWPWWLLRGGRKEKEPEALKFPSPPTRAANISKRKDLQVESFGSSGSESVALALAGDGPEWSVGWTEPHGPDFQSDDGGFLVLVPCYRALVEASSNNNNQLLSAVKNLPSGLPPDGKNYMEQWLSSLQNL
ncbi:PREDICTED: uncharacterized protein LOC104729355 [Camelina sativa]|uniref:Uncharacterized protein LOC104729355 n=1 Tax=Camelina sativa TaxID=90675 RepID=A0ABM0UUL7_CAMSA|nr:PREDICTED: uncharacterized protein LOC104729355 [Camelina sativa]